MRVFTCSVIWLLANFFLVAPLTAQEGNLPSSNDPYLATTAVRSMANDTRMIDNFMFLTGLTWGISPMLIFSPALSFSAYVDPIIVGIELVDSEILGAFEREKLNGIGNVRFLNNVGFAKLFIGQSFYVVGSYEQRKVKLYNRKFNRYFDVGPRLAQYDMFVNTKAMTFGIGVQKFAETLFISFDFLRWTHVLSNSYTTVIHSSNWSDGPDPNDGFTSPSLLEDIEERGERWYKTLSGPTAMILTVGVHF